MYQQEQQSLNLNGALEPRFAKYKRKYVLLGLMIRWLKSLWLHKLMKLKQVLNKKSNKRKLKQEILFSKNMWRLKEKLTTQDLQVEFQTF